MLTKIKYYLGFLILNLLIACATPGAPTGGPMDKDAPLVLNYEPEMLTKNFEGNFIRITFNEWIQIQDVQNQVIISPPIDPFPDIQARKNELLIKLDSKLKDSTTYSFYFGDAIKDNTEGNKAENVLYVFSTGSSIDSIEISGTVKTLQDQSLPENTFVLLYESFEDSIVTKQKPLYAVKLKKGSSNFSIKYLPNKKFKLVTLTDDNRNFLYDLPTEWIGGFPDTIHLDSNVSGISVLHLLPEPSKFKVAEFNSTLNNGLLQIKLNKALNPQKSRISLQISDLDTITPKPLYFTSETFTFNLLSDSLSISCRLFIDDVVVDSFKVKSDSKGAQSGIISTIPQISLKDSILRLNKNQQLQFVSTIPILKIDTSKLFLSDSSGQNFVFEVLPQDSIWGFSVRADFLVDSQYIFQMSDSALQFVNSTYSLHQSFSILQTEQELSSALTFKVRLPSLDAMYVLSVKTANGKILYEKILLGDSLHVYTSPILEAGTYLVEVIEDVNQSGTWNSGSYWDKRGPERVFRSKEISLKENWEQELDVKVDFSNPVTPLKPSAEPAPSKAAEKRTDNPNSGFVLPNNNSSGRNTMER